MADSIVAQITENLVNTLNGQQIVYNNETHVITCEQQRTITIIDNRYPFIEICGPWVEVSNHSSREMTLTCNYIAEMHIPINDTESLDQEPITKATRNIHADLIKIITSDITRGGNALHTVSSGFGHYYSGDTDAPEFVIYVELIVKTQTSEFDLYYFGG